MAVYESFLLTVSPDRFCIEPLDAQDRQFMMIDTLTHEITLENDSNLISKSGRCKTICGIFGIIKLLAGPYLIVITRRGKVGEIQGRPIWKVLETELVPFNRSTLHLTETQIQDNKTYISMVETMLTTDGFYFSSSYDLTHTYQRLHNTSPEFSQMPLLERADQRFVWNTHILRDFAHQTELSRYCLPILHGFVAIKNVKVNNNQVLYAVISRRCCFRAGTRYFMRGIDQEGHAANFVETEQIVIINDHVCSYVQTRGSIPLFWSQNPNLKYKPKPKIDQRHNIGDAYKNHFHDQVFNYGKQVLINLINQTGVESKLEKEFATLVQNEATKDVKYEAFDFHHECRKMRWDRLSVLINRISDDIEKFGYFLMKPDGTILKTQEGVFRTNCMDCLDRTNVVQSLISRKILQEQFEKLGVLVNGQRVEDQVAFETEFKHIWADNADACSVQYAGTGALKTDFTRTGKRTKFGLLRDGLNSAIRYYKNNFRDGFRQDAIDLFLGNYVVEETEGIAKQSPFRQPKSWRFFTFLALLCVSFFLLVIRVLLPEESLSLQLIHVLFLTGVFVATLRLMYQHGTEFVNQPKLAQAAKIKEE